MSGDRARRLAQLRQAHESGILDEDTYRAAVAALEAEAIAKATVEGAGAVAQDSSVAAGAQGVAVGRDVGGDVLTSGARKEVHYHGPEGANPDALRTAYLSYLFEATSHLSLGGVDPKAASQSEARLNLGAVYTALLTLTPEAHERLMRGEAMAREEQRLSALEQLDRYRRLVLLGDPGSGKTTFVSFVAACLAGEALGQKEVNLALLTAPLPDDEGQDQEERQPWAHGALLPVRVILRDFAARGLPPPGQRATAEHLWRFIAAGLKEASLDDYAPHLRREVLEQCGLLLLDGLDEVPEADRRRTQIKQAVEDLAAAWPRCRVLVTSRTYAYQKQDWKLNGFAETILAPFSAGQVRRFVDRWYAHIAVLRGLHADDAQGRAELLKRAVLGSDRLAVLAVRPLLLTLMASLHAWRGGSLPEKREELYADAVDLLLDWWESPKTVRDGQGQVVVLQPSLAEWLKVDRDKVRDLLNALAYQAHTTQPDLAGTADVPEAELVRGLMQLSQNPDVKPARLVEYLSQRAGLLLPRGEGVYTFPHRTFQEYLAACYLTDHDYPNLVAGLAREAPNRWREVVLLAGAKAARGSTFAVWALVEALCHREPGAPQSDLTDAWGAQLAGQVLVEVANLEQVSEPDQAKLTRVRHWLVHILRSGELPAVERAAAGNTLAQLGDPRFRAEAWYLPDELLLGFVEVPAGPFLMGSDKTKDKDAHGDEQPQHSVELGRYYVGRYPVTVAQFRAFVEVSGHEPHNPRSLRRITNHPVVRVTWHDAEAYCRWLTEVLQTWEGTPEPLARLLREEGWAVRLPVESEWEKAARGRDGWRYPWGNEADANRANYGGTGVSGTSAVGCFSDGASPYGCLDISGNVKEWTAGWYQPYPKSTYRSDEFGEKYRVVRGGSWYLNQRYARCAFRSWLLPNSYNNYVGFRVCVAARQE